MSKEFNYWVSVLKRIGYLAIAIFLTFLAFKLSLFYMPFLIAFIISLFMEPGIKKLMKKFKFSRRLSSIIVFIITFGIIIGILIWGVITLASESTNLLRSFNDYYNKAYSQIQNWVGNINIDSLKIPSELLDIAKNTAFSVLNSLAKWIQAFFTNFVSSITSIPAIAIYFSITILALYFICTDKIYILDELEHHLPEKWMKELSKHLRELIKVLGGYLKAQATLVFISFLICLIGLYILYFLNFSVKFPLLIALGIAFVDALPILGSGTAMVPWGVVSALNGDFKLGVAIIVLWIVMSVVRQFIEPKIVSGNIGIHPIFTIAAMYTGFKFMGVIGLFIGPIVLIILKNIFSRFLDGGVMKVIFDIK